MQQMIVTEGIGDGRKAAVFSKKKKKKKALKMR